MTTGSRASRCCLIAVLASCGPPVASEPTAVHSTSTSTAGGAEPGEAGEAGPATCEVETVWYARSPVSGTASADTRREADEVAWTRACEALRAGSGSDCAQGEVAEVERVHRREGTAYVSEVRLHPGHRRTERASSPDGFAAACEAAATAACPARDCVVSSIEGVPVGMILASDDTVEQTIAAPGECSVELQITLATAEGTGTGSSSDEAGAAAMAEACRALGAEDCSDSDAYTVPTRSLSMRFAEGERSSTVRVTLRHVRVARGHARSETSRLEACQAATADACGEEGCPTEPGAIRLFRVDGVPVHARGPAR